MATLPAQTTFQIAEKVNNMAVNIQPSSSIIDWPNEAGVSFLHYPYPRFLTKCNSSKPCTKNALRYPSQSRAPYPRMQLELYIVPDLPATKCHEARKMILPAHIGSMVSGTPIDLRSSLRKTGVRKCFTIHGERTMV